MLDHKKLSELFFDKSIRVEVIVHLATMAGDYAFAEPVRDMLEDDPDALGALLGVDIDEDFDAEELSTQLYRAGVLGFAVQAATPVPEKFYGEDDGYSTCGWGHYTTKWFYTEALDEDFFGRLVEWKEAYIEDLRKATKAT